MAQTSEHGRIIAAAAKSRSRAKSAVCAKGQSRIWRADHRYWSINVEFQPSGWQKGSYLNIHVAWLWKTTAGYQLSYRPASFIPFENATQFTPLIVEMATTAAIEVQKIRERFKSFSDILKHLTDNFDRDCWTTLDAAVATGLARDFAASRRYFAQIAVWTPHGYAWELQLKADCAALAALLDQPDRFKEQILANIDKRRKLMHLPPDPHCLDELGSTGTP